jgi:hypothetical protein
MGGGAEASIETPSADDEVLAAVRQGNRTRGIDRRNSSLASIFAAVSAHGGSQHTASVAHGVHGRGREDPWDACQSQQASERDRLELSLARFSLPLPDFGVPSGHKLEERKAIISERRAEARAAGQVFEQKHKLAGRQAVTAIRAARDAADMQARAEPYFNQAVTCLRQNRVGLPGFDAGKEEPPEGTTDNGEIRRRPEEGEISACTFSADGELARVLNWLAPLLVSETPAGRLREVLEMRDLLYAERRPLARVFDTYRGTAGLAVGVANGGMPTAPPAGAEDTARELAASAAPGDAWILAGAGSSICRAQWWRMLKESRALGNGLTCSDVDFLVTEAMLLPVIDTRRPGGLYEMDVEHISPKRWFGQRRGVGQQQQGQQERGPPLADAHEASQEGARLDLNPVGALVDAAPTAGTKIAPALPPRTSVSKPPADPHDGLATFNFEALVLALCHLAHTKNKATPKTSLAGKLRSLLRTHIFPAVELAPPMDAIGVELRGPEMSSLIAEHMPMLKLCWEYWNTQQGAKQGRGKAGLRKMAAVAAEDAAARMSKEVFLMNADGGARELLCAENRFNYNELLSMFDLTGLVKTGVGSLRRRHIHDLFEATTMDRPMLADINPANERDEMIFDEFVEVWGGGRGIQRGGRSYREGSNH